MLFPARLKARHGGVRVICRGPRMRFYSVEELSPRLAFLPSGTLWARDAVLARCGAQSYHVSELPELADAVTADSDGMFDVVRDAAEIFRPESVASFESVPVTLGHPSRPVTPGNHRDLAVGHVANVRRGDGDLLVADLLLSEERGVRAVRDLKWRALSAGYDARYEVAADGRLHQRDVVANHVALLPPDQAARCGDLCRVSDAAIRKDRPVSVMAMTDSEFDAVLAKAFGKPARKRTPDKLERAEVHDRASFMRALQARDRAQRAVLAGINAANAAFWARQS